MVSTVRQVKVTDFHTKGAVLLVCFQCVDTLVFVLKQSIRCDVICAIAYCGRHESSHIIKAHADSTRFNEIQQEDYLWEFGVVCGWVKSLQQNICVIRRICGFKAKPQISTNFHKKEAPETPFEKLDVRN